MCQIDAGWNSLEGADSYSVSVTSADGSVIDMGETTGQGTSVWVPYVGSGTYSVSVAAWGTPPGEEDDGTPEVIARDSSMSGGEVDAVAKSPPAADSGSSTRRRGRRAHVREPGDRRDSGGAARRDARLRGAARRGPAPAARRSRSPGEGDVPAAPAEPEVVDTIPADDDCTG